MWVPFWIILAVIIWWLAPLIWYGLIGLFVWITSLFE